MGDTIDEIICPACGKKMKKIYVKELKTHMDISTEGCGGKFLDFGELEKIRGEYSTEKERSEAFKKFVFSEYDKEIL